MTDDMASLQAALAAAFDAGQVLRELDSISVDQPLATRLVETVHALDAYYERIRAGGDALLHSVEALTRDAGTTGETRTGSLMSPDDLRAIDRMPDIRQAVAGVFAPDQGHLRLPAATLADIFLRVVPFAARTPDPRHSPPLPAEQVVDLFLHGALIG